jgi:hypothetical protein
VTDISYEIRKVIQLCQIHCDFSVKPVVANLEKEAANKSVIANTWLITFLQSGT